MQLHDIRKARHYWLALVKTIFKRSCVLMQHSHAMMRKVDVRTQMTV